MNFKCENLEVSMNGQPALTAHSFTQELNLTFLREVTNIPVKLGRMIVEQQLKFESLNIKLDTSLLKALHEVLNFYLKSKFISSIKHTILGCLSDRNFLLTKIIANSTNTEIRLSDEQILEIYEQPKNQDTLKSTLLVSDF